MSEGTYCLQANLKAWCLSRYGRTCRHKKLVSSSERSMLSYNCGLRCLVVSATGWREGAILSSHNGSRRQTVQLRVPVPILTQSCRPGLHALRICVAL